MTDPTSPVVHYEEESNRGNQIRDLVSGQYVPATPEEVSATQPFLRQLVEDYGYPLEMIRSRPQYRVKANPSGGGSYPVDIAVFKSAGQLDRDLYLVVECKKPGSKPEEGENRQIFNYLNFSSAEIGVWTNGDLREFYRKVIQGDKISYQQIPNIPKFGETVDDIGKALRENLRAPAQLNRIFHVIRNYIAGNSVGTTRDETIATEIINLIFCKIYDERFTPAKQLVTFRFQIGESPASVSSRIRSLFEQVKAKYSDVFNAQDTIGLDDRTIAYVVGELQPYALTEASRDAVGEAFEVFIGAALKGSQGQFFTPRNVVKLMVELVDPKEDEIVIDPACGPGGFLIESLRHKWAHLDQRAAQLGWSEAATAEERQSIAIKTINGIEKDSFLAKVAKSYMALMGDGKGGIFCDDSLNLPSEWAPSTKPLVNLGRYDVVLANPPFGKDIKITGAEKLAQYEFGYKFKREGSVRVKTDKLETDQNPQILFIERCVQLARDGGRVGVILPETFFHAPKMEHVRKFFARHNILALIDLPHNTFRPFNNAKCIAIIFQKDRPQESTVKMICAEQMGHDHKGQVVYRYNQTLAEFSDEVWDDISDATKAIRDNTYSDLIFETDVEQVLQKDIFVPRYYWSRLRGDLEAPTGYDVEWARLGDLVEAGLIDCHQGHGSPPAGLKGRGEYPYVRVADIINWEIYRNPTTLMPEHIWQTYAASNPVEPEDVLYVARGSYRIGDVAMAGPFDRKIILTKEIHTFRCTPLAESEALTPYYLLYLLTTPSVKRQTKGLVFLDTTMPTIGQRYFDLLLPLAKQRDQRNSLHHRTQRAVKSRWKAMESIRNLMMELGVDDLSEPEFETAQDFSE